MDFIYLIAGSLFWAAAVGLAHSCECLASRKVTP